MAPNESITVSAPTDKQIAAFPREFALFRQLDHTHKGQIPLKVLLPRLPRAFRKLNVPASSVFFR